MASQSGAHGNSVLVPLATSSAANPSHAPHPLGDSAPSLILPFQANVYDITGIEEKTWTVTVQHVNSISKLILPFRKAVLEMLEAVVFLSAPLVKIPVTLDLCWTSADVHPQTSSILQTPGATRITIGALASDTNYLVPADLRSLNPRIKSHLPYTDTPRLTLGFHKSTDAVAQGLKADVKGSVVVRAVVRVSHPSLVPS